MYDNIGKKIKVLALASFMLMATIAIISGVALLSYDEDTIIIGLIVMVGGVVLAWLSSLLLYGFGELIDKTCDIERNTRGAGRESEEQSERISKIEKLRSQGLITEEEYQRATFKE